MLHGSARTIHMFVAISGQLLVTVFARRTCFFNFSIISSSNLKGAEMSPEWEELGT